LSQGLDRVFEEAGNEFSIIYHSNIKITRIDANTLRYWTENCKAQNNRQPPNGGWDWVYKTNMFKASHGRYVIDVAIWNDGILCGLALGKVSKGMKQLSIHYIESSPDEKHSLKGLIFELLKTILKDYATLLNVEKIILVEPVDGLIKFYESHDFLYKKKRLFGKSICEMSLAKNEHYTR